MEGLLHVRWLQTAEAACGLRNGKRGIWKAEISIHQ